MESRKYSWWVCNLAKKISKQSVVEHVAWFLLAAWSKMWAERDKLKEGLLKRSQDLLVLNLLCLFGWQATLKLRNDSQAKIKSRAVSGKHGIKTMLRVWLENALLRTIKWYCSTSKKLKGMVTQESRTETQSKEGLIAKRCIGVVLSNGVNPNKNNRRHTKFLRELYQQKHWLPAWTERVQR